MGIYYGDLSVEYNDAADTSDATIISKEVMYNEVAYGANGKIVGDAPLSFVENNLYKLENVSDGIELTINGYDKRHIVVDANNGLKFEDEVKVVTSTLPLEDGVSKLENGTFYFVLEE